jgi:sec-independent protein translocase protein TatB
MFDIAWSELLLIAVVALIFIGPKELPQMLHTLARAAAKLRRTADDFRRQFEDSMREAGYEDLHKNIQDFRALNPASQLKESIDRAVNQEYAPKPVQSLEPAAGQSALPDGTSSQSSSGQGEPGLDALVHEPSAEPSAVAPSESAAQAAVLLPQQEPGREQEGLGDPAPRAVEPKAPADETIKERTAPVA